MKNWKQTFIGIVAIIALANCTTGGNSVSGTVSLDEALANATEELGSNINGKTEIVIAAIKAPDSNIADFLTAELTTFLMRNGKFTVLERGDALQAVNAEHQFQMSGLVSDESAVGIGHYLGAKIVVSGTFDPYVDFSQLRLRAVDVESSQLLAMPSSRINPRDRVLTNIIPKNTEIQMVNLQALEHMNRGKDLHREGRFDEAIKEFDQAIALDKNLAMAYFLRGDSSIYTDDFDLASAMADFSEAIRLDPNNEGAYYFRAMGYLDIGDEYMEIGDYNRAITAYNQAIEDCLQYIRLDPSYADSFGFLEDAREGLEEAREGLERVQQTRGR